MASSVRRCINCSLRLKHGSWQSLREVNDSIYTTLSAWTSPTPISRDGIICIECFAALQATLTSGFSHTPMLGHRSVCFACGSSILRARSIQVPANSEERNIIMNRVYPHLMQRLDRVCRACWMATKRTIQRHLQHDVKHVISHKNEPVIENSQVPEPDVVVPVPEADVPVPIIEVEAPVPIVEVDAPVAVVEDNAPVPTVDIAAPDVEVPLQNIELSVPDEENYVAHIPNPPPLPPYNIYQPPRRQEEPKIISQIYKRVAVSTRHCVFSNCRNMERLLIPRALKEEVLSRYRIYIPQSARICNFHLYNDCWDELQVNYSDFTGIQMDNLLTMLERISMKQINFSNVHMIQPNLCHYWLGLNATQFYELMDNIPQLYDEVPDASVALSIYLTKLRSGDSNERLCGLFNMPRTSLERYMNKVRDVMTLHLVPNYLGLSHMTVQEVAAMNTVIPEGFYGRPTMPVETKPAITICDATYIYLQSSSNYLFQKQTYSLHKYTNLVKPFMIVCCNGHILDCLGPYKATTNDATIMSTEFSRTDGPMRQYFREGDVFILDRGFRDVVGQLQEYGYQTHLPESLLEGHHQLTTVQANKSRCVTMCRWVVEIVNGRLKQDFKLFRQDFFNRAAKHLMEDFRIGCALVNKFRPVLEDKPVYTEYLHIAQQRLNVPNHLADVVEAEHLNRRRTGFLNIDGNHPHLNDFPRLTMDDLKKLALGTYQLKQARSYYGEHVRQNGTYTLQINNVIEDDIPLILGVNNYIIRGRIKSRHVSSRSYYTYLLINRHEDTVNTLRAISGYYCSCLVGRRTVGCCAHVMTITWYLSWGRHNNIDAPAPFLDDIFEEYTYENIE